MLFICYPKCSTCQKAGKWLDEHGVAYTQRHIVEENPTYEELKKWHALSGLPQEEVLQYKRNVVQGNEVEGQAPDDERG